MKKFIDSNNHDYNTILVKEKGEINKHYLFEVEDSLLWKSIKVGVVLKKKKGSLLYILTSNKNTDSIKVVYDCDHIFN